MASSCDEQVHTTHQGPLLRYDLLMLNSSPKTTYRLIASIILLEISGFVNKKFLQDDFYYTKVRIFSREHKKKTIVFKSFPVNIMLIAGIEPATSSLPWMRSAN